MLDEANVIPVLTDHSSTPVAALMAVKWPSIVLTSTRRLQGIALPRSLHGKN